MRQTRKATYIAPVTELCENYCQPYMINIGSGETTPEESDSNVNFFNEEEDGNSFSYNRWDNL